MAKSSPTKKAWRSLSWLGVIIVGLIIANGAGVLTGGGSWTPKLALDLEGGTQIILAPKLESGQTVSSQQLNQAVSIIRQRIDSAGVSESEINTQGGQNIVVSIPGTPDDATLNRIQSSAKLEFRPVLVASAPTEDSVGADRESWVAGRGEDRDHRGGRIRAQVADQLGAAHHRHHHVGDHERRRRGADLLQCGFAVTGLQHLMTGSFEDPP